MRTVAHVWRLKDSLLESLLPSHGPRDQATVIKLGSRHLGLLGRLAGHHTVILLVTFSAAFRR